VFARRETGKLCKCFGKREHAHVKQIVHFQLIEVAQHLQETYAGILVTARPNTCSSCFFPPPRTVQSKGALMKKVLVVLVVSLLAASLSAVPANADASQTGCRHSDGRAAGCSTSDKKTDEHSNGTKSGKVDDDRNPDLNSNISNNRYTSNGYNSTDSDLKSDRELLTKKTDAQISAPEPSSLGLIAVGIAGMAGLAFALSRRRSLGN